MIDRLPHEKRYHVSLHQIHRHARASHFMDGTDDALVSAVGRQMIAAH